MYDELIATLALAIVGVIGKKVLELINYYLNKYIQDQQYNTAKDVLLAGMAKAQNEIVREIKQSTSDGKLSLDDIKKAEQVAINYAIEIADGTIKELLKSWTPERVSSEIKQLLSRFKK